MADLSQQVLGVVEALFDFKASDSVGLSFNRGDKITVHEQAETGWWEGSLANGKRGWFPSNFTTAIGEEPKSKWIEQTTSTGHVFYYNVLTGESAWEIPKEDDIQADERRASVMSLVSTGSSNTDRLENTALPEGWTMHETDDGKTFYFNKTTKQASWTFPTEDAAAGASAAPGTAAASASAPAKLPRNWFMKKLPDGRQYYYNSVTNETVWSVDEISQAKLSADAILAVNAVAAAQTQGNIDALAKLAAEPKRDAAWVVLVQKIVDAFVRLNNASKTSDKSVFVEATKGILNSIREMLIASGTYEPNAPALMKNKILSHHHRGLTDNLSKLVLAAKLASGVWPPPDAITKMQTVASEILIAVRLFVTAANEAGILVSPDAVATYKSSLKTNAKVPPKIVHPKPKLQGQMSAPPAYYRRTVAPSIPQRFPVNAPAAATSAPAAPPVVPPSSKKPASMHAPPPGVPPALRLRSDSGPSIAPPSPAPSAIAAPLPAAAVATPQHASTAPVHPSPLVHEHSAAAPEPEPDEIDKAIIEEEEALQAQAEAAGIDGDGDESVLGTEAHVEDSSEDTRRIARLDESAKTVLSSVEDLVQHVKKTGFGKTVGDQKLAILSSKVVVTVGTVLEVADEIDEAFSQQPYDMAAFRQTKAALFDTIAGLVSTARQATDPLAPSDALKQVMMGIQATVNAVHQVVIACKQLIEFKENTEHDILQETLDESFGGSSGDAPVASGAFPAGYTPKRSMSLATLSSTLSKPMSAAAAPEAAPTPAHAPVAAPAPVAPAPVPASAPTVKSAQSPEPADAKLPRTASSAATSKPLDLDDDDEVNKDTVRKRSNNKLGKFFGEEVDVAKRGTLSKAFGDSGAALMGEAEEHGEEHHPSGRKKAFLGVDYKPDELVLNMEGKVKGGTLAAMVERMTQHDVLDTEFMLAFLLTYRSFTTPRALLEQLMARYNLQPPADLSTGDLKLFTMKKQTPIRLRVINVIKLWVENYFEDFQDDQLLQYLTRFIKEHIHTVLKNPAEHLQNLLRKKAQGTISRKMVFSGKAPLPVLGKGLKAGKFSVLDLEPLEVARQLSLMESKLYNQIQPSECLNKAWSDPKLAGRAENIRAMIERSNQLTAWVAFCMLAEDQLVNRIKVLRHFLMIADKCRSLNNFNSLMAILAAFNSAPVHRLKRTWTGLGTKERKLMEQIRSLMESAGNFSNYRKTLHSIQPPCVPFLGVYLTDLTFIEDGNKDLLNGDKMLINFDKRLKVAIVIREIQQYQSAQYCLQPVELIEAYLLQNFRSARAIDDMYETSLKLEPRESSDDTVLRLLQESGFI